jgi:hypothetical protein
MIAKGQQAPYLYDVRENVPHSQRPPAASFTFALPAMLKFQFALSAI